MNRKASMELSVNSIVILVIAIVIMGLLLGFIRSKFAEVGGNVIVNEPEAQSASAYDTLMLSRETVSMASGKSAVIKANVYNPLPDTAYFTHINMSCGGLESGPKGITIKSANTSIKLGEQASYVITLKISNNAKGSYLCTIFAEGWAYNFTGECVDDEDYECGASDPTKRCGAASVPNNIIMPTPSGYVPGRIDKCYGKIYGVDVKDIILQVK